MFFGLICACGASATFVWPAYGQRPSHFDCLRREWSATPVHKDTLEQANGNQGYAICANPSPARVAQWLELLLFFLKDEGLRARALFFRVRSLLAAQFFPMD